MLTETCDACGATLSGETREEFVADALDHYSTVHPKWGLKQTSIENWVDAMDRVSEATERLDSIGNVEVHQATADRIDDVLRFFDHDAFADNAGWAACYCMFYHRDDLKTFPNTPWRKNREDLAQRLQEGSTIGYLAYVDGKPAGWCNASLRSAYPVRHKGSEDDEVGVVACFVIAPPYRRHGLSQKLLDAAVDGFRARGIKRVEAHPVIGKEGDAPSYHGPLPLYLSAGFEEVERDEKTVLVAKELSS